MRILILTVAAALGLGAAPAYAQGANADGLRPKPAVDAVETSPLLRLKYEARTWIAEEKARQKANPTELVELAVDIDSNIGEPIRKLAKRERVGNGDLILVVMYDIVGGARDALEGDIERMRKSGAPDAEIQKATATKAVLDARVAEVVQSQTVVSRSLVPQLAWSQ